MTRWGLPPEAFWRLTPREIALALRGLAPEAVAPPTPSDVAALLARYPDRPDGGL